jgi:protein phosphatase/serine/threonine-protein kinase
MSFETSTGTLSGTPTSVAGATAYTITATNATGSATQIFTLTVVAIVYAVGDTGPGGGIVFYVSASVFTSTESTCGTVCRYLEAAPNTWSGGVVDPYQLWADAVVATLAYTSGSTNDWYLPSKDELNELYLARTTVGGFKLDYYWSSSANGSIAAFGQFFDNSGRQNSLDKPEPNYVRPVRAF